MSGVPRVIRSIKVHQVKFTNVSGTSELLEKTTETLSNISAAVAEL